jgi:hypothetical protein
MDGVLGTMIVFRIVASPVEGQTARMFVLEGERPLPSLVHHSQYTMVVSEKSFEQDSAMSHIDGIDILAMNEMDR